MDNAERDENRVTTVTGVSSVDFETIVTVAVNPVNHALIVKVG